MKMKKIIALAIATVVSLASVANAAFFDDAGWTMTDSYPTTAEVAARSVTLTPSVEAISLTDAVALGITSRGKTEENTDCYKVTYTISGIGDLYRVCYADDTYSNYVELRLFDVSVTIPSFTTKQVKLVSGSLNGKDFSYASPYTKLVWNAGSLADCYPTEQPEEGVLVQDLTLEAVVVYALNEGAEVNVAPTVSATYNVQTVSGNKATDAVGTSTSNIVMAPAAVTTRTITFVDYDNSSSDVVVNDGEAITAPAAKGQTGYTFSGWSSVSASGAVDFESGVTTASADATYYAVYAPIAVSSVTISGATAATVGDSVSLSAAVLPVDALDKTVTWTLVSGTGAVTDAGVVTASAAGPVVVKATAGGVDSANYTVTFAAATVPATGIEIKGGATKAVVGNSVTFTADVDPSTSTDVVEWSIVGDGATVENGVVSATKAGKFTVTATAGSVSDSKDITFIEAPAAPAVVKPVAKAAAVVGDYNYLTSHATVTAPDFANFDYSVWAKDDKEVTETVGTITAEKLKNIEGEGIVNFLLMVKSKTHTIIATGITPVLK